MQSSPVNLTHPAKKKKRQKKELSLAPRSCLKLDWTLQCFSSDTCFHRKSNSHSLVLPSHLFCLSLARRKNLSGSKDLLWGARRGPGYASDHRCMRGIWWHKAWVMWYCHQSALTRLAPSWQTPARPRSYSLKGRSRTGHRHAHTYTHTHIDTQSKSRAQRHTMSFTSQAPHAACAVVI